MDSTAWVQPDILLKLLRRSGEPFAAVGLLDAEPAECAFIGDSPTDVMAGHLAGVPVIGYANKPAKVEALARVQAAAVTTSLADITTALRAAPSAALPN